MAHLESPTLRDALEVGLFSRKQTAVLSECHTITNQPDTDHSYIHPASGGQPAIVVSLVFPHLSVQSSCGGLPGTQKKWLRSPQLRIPKLSKVPSFNPGTGQNIVLHVSSAACQEPYRSHLCLACSCSFISSKPSTNTKWCDMNAESGHLPVIWKPLFRPDMTMAVRWCFTRTIQSVGAVFLIKF